MEINKSIATFGIRTILGLIFLMQGYGKVFTIGVRNLIEMDFFHNTFKDLLPFWLIKSTAYYTSYIELICGALLLVGFKVFPSLYALLSVLVIVTFGHGLAEPIWDLSHLMYRLILIVSLLFVPNEWDKFSIDSYIKQQKAKNIKF